jgi:hypothetical protein
VYCHTDNIASQRRAERKWLSGRCVRRPVLFQKKPGLRYAFGHAYANATVFDHGHMLCDTRGWGWISINISTSPRVSGESVSSATEDEVVGCVVDVLLRLGRLRLYWMGPRGGSGCLPEEATDGEATEVKAEPERARAGEAGTCAAVGASRAVILD